MKSPKPGDKVFAGSQFALAARPADALRAAESAVRAAGYECINLGDRVEGEARDVAAAHAERARALRAKGARAAILSGGELTVTIRGNGRGGPNQEYALALAIELAGMANVAALAGDTDGTDGGEGLASDPAGALLDGETVARAKARASIPPPFSPTMIRPDFSPRSATFWSPDRPSPTSTTFVPSSLTGRDGSRQNRA